jgi:hypothetical protein
VPRYFFHFSDGRRQFTDETGHELAGIRAARAHAVREVREMRAALSETGVRDLSSMTMLVVDGQGRAVFSLGFDLRPRETGTPRPAPGPERGTRPAAKTLNKKS